MVNYVLDTYAIIEYLKGNKKYIEKIKNAEKFAVTRLNLMELYFASLRDNDEETAERHLEAYRQYEVYIDEKLIKDAMKTRLRLKRSGLDISYSDAIGYQLALNNDAKFLTGDKEFEKLDGVEYVK